MVSNDRITDPGSRHSTRPRVGLVLAGGGVAGYGFHAGVLRALEAETGWDPRSAEVILGTSSGSIVAAILRAGIDTKGLKQRALDRAEGAETTESLEAVAGAANLRMPAIWKGPASPKLLLSELRRGRRLRPSNLVTGVLPSGRLPTAPLGDVIRPYHQEGWPSKTLWITATNLATGRRAVFGRDDQATDVATAVEASCAIPAYFVPVAINGEHYIDGGMRSPDNADLLADHALDVVVISSPLSIDQPEPRRSPIHTTLRAYPRRRLKANVRRLEAAETQVIVLEPNAEVVRATGINAMDPARLTPILTASERMIIDRLGRSTLPERKILSRLSG